MPELPLQTAAAGGNYSVLLLWVTFTLQARAMPLALQEHNRKTAREDSSIVHEDNQWGNASQLPHFTVIPLDVQELVLWTRVCLRKSL